MPRTPHISPLSLRPLTLAVALLLLCLNSCAPIREAQQVVAEADSLRTAGVPYADSTTMADAAATLEQVRLIYPTAYAHANYYYGRILREAGNQPEAMLAFLRVVHSRTKDHTIKGRSYSNIANMCRLAAEHELACEIYEKAAEEFLLGNDSLNYFYVTNGKAIELAELSRRQESVTLTNYIEKECSIADILTRIWETRADAYLMAEMYDSAIYCVRQLQARGNHEPTGTLLKARAFSYLGMQDSAVYYAQQVVESTSSWFDLNNAYYILANDDENKNKKEVLQVAGYRADVQKLIEIRQGQLSQATQLLEQDLSRKPDLKWLLAVLLTLAVIGIALSMYLKRKRRKHQLISQQIEDVQAAHQKKVTAEIEIFCQSITDASSLKTTLCWNDFNKMCAIVNSRMYGLADKLKASGIKNPRQIQLCILVVIGKFRDKQMGDILCYADNTVRSSKKETAKILGISGKNLRFHLLQMAGGQ